MLRKDRRKTAQNFYLSETIFEKTMAVALDNLYERKLFIKSFLSNSLSKIFISNSANIYNAKRYKYLRHSQKVFWKIIFRPKASNTSYDIDGQWPLPLFL